jgi:selenocysteine lyase/cysteine desulfurase
MISLIHSDIPWDHARYFDVASLARVPEGITAAALEPIPTSRDEGADHWHTFIDSVKRRICGLFAPHDHESLTYHLDNISLFTNTTGAFCRILTVIERYYEDSRPTLMTSDLEFPGCLTAIDDSWRHPVVMAQIAGMLTDTSDDIDKLLHDALVSAYNIVKPRVVLVSHVMRTTGQVISVDTLRYFKEANPAVITILDGSQAIGNVVVDQEVLECVDFYIASGHKWLGGMTTTGFVWRNDNRWTVDDPTQSLAYRGQLGGTGNGAAWASLLMAIDDLTKTRANSRLHEIADHNQQLGQLFLSEIEGCSNIRPVTPRNEGKPPSGLVTIDVDPPAGDTVEKALQGRGFEFTVIGYEEIWWRSPATNRYLVSWQDGMPRIKPAEPHTHTRPATVRTEARFCFHYWHCEDDVRTLATALREHAATG